MDRCKYCSNKMYQIIKLKCNHDICISCIVHLNKLKCTICDKNFYEELSDEVLKELAKNINGNLN